jgi:hypothetical protein
VRAFYGQPPRRSYFHSCSNGGRQALTAAERHPTDYDGISAGAPSFHLSLDISNPRLDAFRAAGGKLLLYHGENDNPEASVQYHRRLIAKVGQEAADDFVRLYVPPGDGSLRRWAVSEFGAAFGHPASVSAAASRAAPPTTTMSTSVNIRTVASSCAQFPPDGIPSAPRCWTS